MSNQNNDNNNNNNNVVPNNNDASVSSNNNKDNPVLLEGGKFGVTPIITKTTNIDMESKTIASNNDTKVNTTTTISTDNENVSSNVGPTNQPPNLAKANNVKVSKSRFRKLHNNPVADKQQDNNSKIKDEEKAKINDYKEKLTDIKQTIKSYFDSIVLKTYPGKIVEFRQFQVDCINEINDILANQPNPTIIPVVDSLSDQLTKIENQPNQIEKWIKANPDLQCCQLRQRPALYKGCKLETNKRISALIEKFFPIVHELDQDMRSFHCAVQLMLPKMRDGEFIGAQLLHEIKDKIDSHTAIIERITTKLVNYHNTRHQRIQNVLQYNHLEDYRFLFERYDQKYCLSLRKCMHDIYRIYVVMYDLIKKNYDKLSEFKNMNDDDSFDSSTDCSFYY